MSQREMDSLKKKSLLTLELSTKTKSSVISADLVNLAQSLKKMVARKKSVVILVVESD